MSDYQSFHSTGTGYSHVTRGTVCQDASASCDEGNVHVAVVSDGHGQKASFRSDMGSRIAVGIAVEKLKTFALGLEEQGTWELLFQEGEREKLLRQLARSIVGNWNIQTLQNLVEHPITAQEYDIAEEYGQQYREGENLLQIFGSTLIAAMATDRYLLVMHQGDGRCVVLHEDGSIDQPVPWDDQCVGNTTTSLCQEDAVERFRFYVADLRKDRVVACFVATDGVEDSYDSMKDFNAFICSLTSLFSREGAGIEKYLEEYLPELSRHGSQDDASVAGIVDAGAAAKMADRLELIYQYRSYCRELKEARSKLRSMQRKREYLKSQYEAALRDCKAIRDRNRKTEAFFGRIPPEHADELAGAERKLCLARDAYEEYRQKRNTHVEKAKEARDQALAIRQALIHLGMAEKLEEEPEEAQALDADIRQGQENAEDSARSPVFPDAPPPEDNNPQR